MSMYNKINFLSELRAANQTSESQQVYKGKYNRTDPPSTILVLLVLKGPADCLGFYKNTFSSRVQIKFKTNSLQLAGFHVFGPVSANTDPFFCRILVIRFFRLEWKDSGKTARICSGDVRFWYRT